MKAGKFAAIVWMAALLASCGGGGGANVTVTISPISATVRVSTPGSPGTQPFSAVVNGSSNQNVTWAVNKIVGGNATVGTISTNGLYTAPTTVPNPAVVIVTATSQANTSISATANVTIDSGIRVTISPATATVGTGENLAITPTVTGSSNTTINWTVNGVTNGNPMVGQICTSMPPPCTAPSGAVSGTVFYLAPTTAPNPDIVTVTAKSAFDTNQSATLSVTVLAATDPVLTAIAPGTVAQGSVFQDIYLSGLNFFSTSAVRVNSTVLKPCGPSNAPFCTTFLSTTFLKVRIPDMPPDSLLATAGSLSVSVQRQNLTVSSAQTLTVAPVRPAIVSSAPDSVPQNGPLFSASFNGGYFGTSAIPAVTAKFNGQPRTGSVVNTRQLNVTILASDLTQAGLFPLVIRNNGVPAGSPAIATTNIAVEPIVGSPAPSSFPVGTQPSAVAINTATGTVVVANSGSNNVSVFSLSSPGSVTTVPVGTAPTGVAVDNIRNIAAVVNSSNSVTIVNLAGTPAVLATLPLPPGTTPFSIGLNPLTGRGLVANRSTNTATVIDVTTPSSPSIVGPVSVSTGLSPQVAIEPRLNWAVVTPGGAGSASIVNLGRPASPGDLGLAPFLVARVLLTTTSFQGIAINTETEQALLTDPNGSTENLMSLLDQTPSLFTLDLGEVAAAVNPLTNIGVTVNSVSNMATVVDLRTKLSITTVNVGTSPLAVAIDPVSNKAVVANAGSNNVTVFSLGTIRSLHITEISPASTFAIPPATCAGAPPVALTVIGNGFVSGSVLRLDEVALPLADVTSVSVDGRQLTASIPACMMPGQPDLSKPRLYAVDVLNPDMSVSNVTRLSVIQAIAVGTAPQGVTIDSAHELAVVTNSGSNTVSIVNLNTGTASTPIAVGTNPQGVAVLPRLGTGGVALVANNGSNNASLIDLTTQQVTNTITVGSGPLGVAIQPDTAVAVVANANTLSNTLSVFRIDTVSLAGSIAVDQRPESVAVDPLRNFAAVGNTTQQTVVLVNLSTNVLAGRPPCPPNEPFCFANPTGIAFDPVTDVFVVTGSLANNLNIVDPGTLTVTPLLVGVNPNSVDYNFQTGTLVTANSESHTLSVMDFQGQRVTAVLGVDCSAQFSVAIDSRSNLAVVADQNNNRILVIPLPR